MALAVIKAMLRSPTPDDFLEQVLSSVKHDTWIINGKPTKEEMDVLSKDKHLYPGVNFSDPSTKPLFLGFQRTEWHGVEKPPRLEIGGHLHLSLTEDAWNEAARSLQGVVKEKHPISGTVSKFIRIPLSAVAHWTPYITLRPGKKWNAKNTYSTIRITASRRLIEEINKYAEAHETTNNYLTALNQYDEEDRLSSDHFISLLKLPRPANLANKKFDEVAYLFTRRPRVRELAVRLGEIARKSAKRMAYPSIAEMSSVLSEHFGIEDGAATRNIAERIQDHWAKRSIFSAVDLANRGLKLKPAPRRR